MADTMTIAPEESEAKPVPTRTILWSVEELLKDPNFRHLKPATLARWRSEGKGPRVVRIGRTPFYDPADVETWIQQEKERCEHQRKIREMVLPVQNSRKTVRREHRFTGYAIKRERGQTDRGPKTA